MNQRSITAFLDNFYRRDRETAYAHRRGYRLFRWSYSEVARTASQFARELEARGIGKGDRVMIWGENCAEWVVAFVGCLLRGAVVVPMDKIASADFAQRVGREVRAKLWICSLALSQNIRATPVLVLEDLRETLARHSREPYPSTDLLPDEPMEIVFTSGSTGEPKGVVISAKNMFSNLDPLEGEVRKYLKYERLVHPLRFLELVPLSHVFGQFLGIFVPQLLGGTVFFQDTLNPSEVIRTVRLERISAVVAVPRLLEALKNKLERDFEAAGKLEHFVEQTRAAEGEHFLRRWWRFRRVHRMFGWKFWAFVSGGAALDPQVETFWKTLGYAVAQGYGLTETASLVTLNHPLKPKSYSIGKALPGVEVRLDENGEILVRGKNVSASYWQGGELKRVLDGGGWFHTGDRGELDENGHLFFKGRRSEVIVTSEGMKVFPEDLERVLRRQFEVSDCAVIGVARGMNAEPWAVVILRDGAQNPEAAVRRANESLAGYQQIRNWIVWPEEDFPRTSTQKVRTRLVQEAVQKQLGAPGMSVSSDGTGSAADRAIADLIQRITGRAPLRLTAETSLESDLNLSSVERVELLSALEDRYQTSLNETKFAAATTVGELEQMLRESQPARSDYRYPRWAQQWPITWIRLAVYYLLSWPATLLLGYPRVRGGENLKDLTGPVLFVSNHVTAIDIGPILAALPMRFRHRLAVAMFGELLRSMRHPPDDEMFLLRAWDKLSYALVVALFNVFPLPQQTGFRESFAFSGESADRGYSILVFPEGQRTLDGEIAPFRAGVGLLARGLDVPVVPVRIDGLFELKQAGKFMTRPGAIRVTIGRPVGFRPETEPGQIASELENNVKSLVWPSR